MDGETAWFSTAAYFVALVNPASKVFLLSSWEPPLTSLPVGRWLERIYATGPLIRIAGMIVAAMAVQMVLAGLADWTRQIAAFTPAPHP